MQYLGNFAPGATIDFKFTTVNASGVPHALSSGAVLVYKDNSTTESSSSGITLTASHDSRTGMNHVRITTSSQSSFFTAGSQFQVVLTGGTVDGNSVVGYIVATFNLEAEVSNVTHWRGALVNTLQSGRVDSYVGALASSVITAASIASDAIQAAKIQDGALTAAKFASGAFDAVWSVASRILTAGTNIVLSKGTGLTGLNDLSAGDVRGAVGLASANLDTQLGGLATSAEVAGLNDISISDVETALGNYDAAKASDLAGLSTFDASTDAVNVGAVGGNAVTSPDDFKADVSGLSTFDPAEDTVTVGTNNDKTGYSLATTPPTAAQIRAELDDNSTKLANLDATMSSRLAGSAYTAPANSDVAAIKVVTDRLDGLVEDSGGDRFTAKALEQAPTGEGGGGLSAEDVWTYSDRSLTDKAGFAPTAEEVAAEIDLSNLDVAVSSRSTLTAQQVWEYGTRTLSSFGALASDVATAVWGATTRTLSAFGFSVTVATNNDKSGYSLAVAPPTAEAIAAEVADTLDLSNLDAPVSSRLAAADYDPAAGGASAEDVWTYAERSLTDKAGFVPTGATVTLISPVLAGGTAYIQQGDDYAAADGRALVWTLESGPDLAGADVIFKCAGVTFVMSAAGLELTLELTALETAAFSEGGHPYEIEATLASGSRISLVRGELIVQRNL